MPVHPSVRACRLNHMSVRAQPPPSPSLHHTTLSLRRRPQHTTIDEWALYGVTDLSKPIAIDRHIEFHCWK